MCMDKSELKERQKAIDAEYIQYGLTESDVDKQIELNKLRAEHDLNLDDELNDDGFAQ